MLWAGLDWLVRSIAGWIWDASLRGLQASRTGRLEEQGELVAAIDPYGSIVDRGDPECTPLAPYLLGTIAERLGRWDEAQACRRADRAEP